jgi:hypothetical protein
VEDVVDEEPAPVGAPPGWAVWCAWLVPLLIVPSAIWRASEVVTDPAGFWAATAAGGWYLLLLSAVSIALGLLTLGLVQEWGATIPGWVPGIGGRRVPLRFATTAAFGGGTVLILLTVWFFVYTATRPFEVAPLIGADEPVHARPGWSVLRWYLPLVAWGPLVVVIAADHRRRRLRRG